VKEAKGHTLLLKYAPAKLGASGPMNFGPPGASSIERVNVYEMDCGPQQQAAANHDPSNE
jgi:hypothetical protein